MSATLTVTLAMTLAVTLAVTLAAWVRLAQQDPNAGHEDDPVLLLTV